MIGETVIREAQRSDIPGIAKVNVLGWKTTYPGIVPQSYLDSLTPEQQTKRLMAKWGTYPGATTLVAEDAGQIVGYAAYGPAREEESPFKAELYAIYLLPECQGAGLGRKMVQNIASALLEQQHYSMYVWVLTANPFRSFYQKLGGVYIKSSAFEIDGISIPEDQFGWQDIRTLLPSS